MCESERCKNVEMCLCVREREREKERCRNVKMCVRESEKEGKRGSD